MDALRADLRYAYRRLLASPGFAAVAIASIALGVGASTAVFGTVHRVLFAPLPYPHAERIVALTDRNSEGERLPLTYGTYREVSQRTHSFERLAVADRWQPALEATGDPERVDGDRVTADYFRVLGVLPAFGRGFDAADDRPGDARVAIISASLAKRRFGGVSRILGRSIVLDGGSYAVIGVMPESFRNALAPTAEVWAPLQYRDQAGFQEREWGHHLRAIGLLAPGVTAQQASAEIEAIAAAPVAEFPRPVWAALESGLNVESLTASLTYAVRPVLLAILGAVLLLLAIACVNVTNLLLARALARRAELAVRTALGAGRLRLIRQLVTESLLIALLGGIVGLGVAVGIAHALVALAPAGLPRGEALGLDGWMFSMALVTSTIVGLVMGVIPALRGVRANLYVAVRSGSRATDARHHVIRHSLVVTQVALAFVLVTGAGLLLRTVDRLLATAPGFDADQALSLQVVATGRRYGSVAEVAQLFQQSLEAVRALPGVVDAAFTSQLPLSGDYDSYGVVFESRPAGDNGNARSALRYAVTPGWFRTMGIALVAGRVLGPDDRPDAPPAVLINESFAKRRFGAESPLGQRLRMGPNIGRPGASWATVVGVVGDVKQASLALEAPDAVYIAMGQWPWVDIVQSLVVRTRGDALTLAPSVERAIWSVDPTPPLVRVTTLSQLLERSEAQRSFALVIFAAFGIAAVVLAIVGLYGVVTGSVEDRQREIGVRAALGASPLRVAALVVRQGMLLVGLGIVVGVAGAAAGTRGLASLLFGVTPFDASTYTAAIALVTVLSLLACAFPAMRAARIDPAITLRAD